MSARKSLGRGLEALVPKEIEKSILEEDKSRVQKLLISDIIPNPEQPRRSPAEQELNELALSIKKHGVLQPIIVVRHKKGYKIVAGERRWQAAKLAGLSDIPAIVRSLEELEQIELALIENIQRVDLTPLEQALVVYKLQQDFNLELEKIAERLGKAPSTVSNLARLLQLPNSAREALRKGQISEGHARTILALKQLPDKQEQLLRSILNNGWTVRQAEQFVVASKRGAGVDKAAAYTPTDTGLMQQISKKLALPVKIKHTARGGQIIIHFKNEQELHNLVKKLEI